MQSFSRWTLSRWLNKTRAVTRSIVEREPEGLYDVEEGVREDLDERRVRFNFIL